jgi:hypothetical protein
MSAGVSASSGRGTAIGIANGYRSAVQCTIGICRCSGSVSAWPERWPTAFLRRIRNMLSTSDVAQRIWRGLPAAPTAMLRRIRGGFVVTSPAGRVGSGGSDQLPSWPIPRPVRSDHPEALAALPRAPRVPARDSDLSLRHARPSARRRRTMTQSRELARTRGPRATPISIHSSGIWRLYRAGAAMRPKPWRGSSIARPELAGKIRA